MKSTIRCIFISIIMHRNFMHLHQKLNFKSALEIFISASGHLRTALISPLGPTLNIKLPNNLFLLIPFLLLKGSKKRQFRNLAKKIFRGVMITGFFYTDALCFFSDETFSLYSYCSITVAKWARNTFQTSANFYAIKRHSRFLMSLLLHQSDHESGETKLSRHMCIDNNGFTWSISWGIILYPWHLVRKYNGRKNGS